MELEAMMTMDRERTIDGVDDDAERPDFRHIAWLLREKLNDFVDGDPGEPPELALRSLLRLAAARKIVSVDPKMMNPVLWGTLPKDLLVLVFSRLPVRDIARLRCLSKKWKSEMATADSDINQACAEASPRMLALLSVVGNADEFLVTTLDLDKFRWQNAYRFRLPFGKFAEARNLEGRVWNTMGASDGGLVCFVSTWKPTVANRLCIVVMNLLTGVQHELPPPHYVYHTPPAIVHIKVDGDSSTYKVAVAVRRTKILRAEVYDSGAKQWTRAAPTFGSLSGAAYSWKLCDQHRFASTTVTPCAHDFAEGLSPTRLSGKGFVRSFTVVKDRLFLLSTPFGRRDYFITKYLLQSYWVEEKTYNCDPVDDLLKQVSGSIHLHGCDNFLMVFMINSLTTHPPWLLNLLTGEWRYIPENFEGHNMTPTLLCATVWNTLP